VNSRKGKIKLSLLFAVTPLILVALLLVFAEAQKGEKKVRVLNNRLSVDLMDAEFGNVMKEIGDKAGFEVKISAAISNKTLSTSFTNMELQRGITRLLTLMGQKNYFIYYNPDNSISKIEVFISGKGPGRRSSTEWRPGPRPRPDLTPATDRPKYPMPPKVQKPMPSPGSPALLGNAPAGKEPVGKEPVGKEPVGKEPVGEEPVGEEPEQKKVPYIPPTQIPAYIPPAKDKP
jgi:hypothetical protein